MLITTSKPVAEGILTIEVEKAVKTNIDYTSNQMKNFKKLTTGMRATVDEEDVKTTKEIKLTEPKTEVLFEISQKELTTAVKNKNIGIRIILNTSDTTKALYKNPTFKIKLPSYIEKCNLNSYDIVMGDGLKIKSAKTATENGQIVINVELEGAQTEYATNAQYVGAVIDINVDLTTKTLTPVFSTRYFPRRQTSSIVRPVRFLINCSDDGCLTSLSKYTSTLVIVFPLICGSKVFLTCSTSGNSGMDIPPIWSVPSFSPRQHRQLAAH